MELLSSNIYAVILAGGSGTRFWPKSRHKSPKQLCKIGSSTETMIEVTLSRLDDFIPPERRMIVTHQDQLEETRRIVNDRCGMFLAEPQARNTANALTLAALEIRQLHKGSEEPIMISLHADHIIKNLVGFKQAIRDGISLAEKNFLTLLGIVPSSPDTGYGYIEQGESMGVGSRVASFREKPQLALAQEYVASKKFYWNAGIFIWKNSILLDEIKKPLASSLAALEAVLGDRSSFGEVPSNEMAEIYGKLPKISIDHAVLETSDRVAVVGADIGWQDVGSWDALSKCFPTDEEGNLLYGDIISIDNRGVTADSDGPLIACIGLENIVVVCSKGAVMVCPKDRAQEVKKVVEHLQQKNLSQWL